MGCDIHLYKEKRVNGVWVTADEWETRKYSDGTSYTDVPWGKRFTDRDYNLFGLLCEGVRRGPFKHSMKPRGMPFNACSEVYNLAHEYGEDGHSHSYIYLEELKDLYMKLRTETMPVSGEKEGSEIDALNATIASGNPDWNLLYPYCKSCSSRTYREFKYDVPASFLIGRGVEKIIEMFNGIDGENHRIVFWFDN